MKKTELVKIGPVEKEILTFLAKNKGTVSPQELRDILNKKHTSYISRAFNTLKNKFMIEIVTNTTHKGQGRPAKLYQITEYGVIYACLKIDPSNRLDVMKNNLEFPRVKYMYAYYSGLKQEKYEHVDQFLEDSFKITLFLFGSKRFDVDEIEAMYTAWQNQRLIKFKGRRRDRFNSSIAKFAAQHDIKKDIRRAKKKAKKMLLG